MKKVLIANRGEIARRIVRAAKKLGLQTVCIYSQEDERNSWIYDADEQYYLEGDTVAETYLSIEQIIRACRSTGADAVHPGYGFLSENAQFASAVISAGITFIGPTPKVIADIGDKRRAKKIAESVTVPTLASTTEATTDGIAEFAKTTPFPLLIKAAFGGGGRGMRVASNLNDAIEFCQRASEEAKKFFSSPEIFIEPYLQHARHIEVQFLGDSTGEILTLGTRDCSLQRNHQKIIEEAPGYALSSALIKNLTNATKKIAKSVQYTNAGTAEFLVIDEKFYFLEVNARIQVEHPVTEEIFGVDLIGAQLQIAQGKLLKNIFPKELTPKGYAIEVRLCAESPRDNFAAETGRIIDLNFPDTVRIESAIVAGDTVGHQFDSMIAKLISYAPTRAEAIQKLITALEQTSVIGVGINSEFILSLLKLPEFQKGTVTTQLLSDLLNDSKQKTLYISDSIVAAHYVAATWSQGNAHTPFRIFGAATKSIQFNLQGRLHETCVTYTRPLSFCIEGDQKNEFSIRFTDKNAGVIEYPGLPPISFKSELSSGTLFVHSSLGQFVFYPEKLGSRKSQIEQKATDTLSEIFLSAHLPGTIVKLLVDTDEEVLADQPILLLESMKMEHQIKSPSAGTVKALHVIVGQVVKKGAALVTLRTK